jgi:hypothetical protein
MATGSPRLVSFLAAAVVFAGCTSGADRPEYVERPFDFSGELLIPIEAVARARIDYTVDAREDISGFDGCFLRAGDLAAWRDDRSHGLLCDVDVSGFSHHVEVAPGRYFLAVYCRPEYADVCRIAVTLDVRWSHR